MTVNFKKYLRRRYQNLEIPYTLDDCNLMNITARLLKGFRSESELAAGYTYFGQFLIHDLSFENTSVLEGGSHFKAMEIFPTPTFDLDLLYGGGLNRFNFMWSQSQNRIGEFLVQVKFDEFSRLRYFDLPRNDEGVAVIPDTRNDENVIISQLHLAWMLIHNKLISCKNNMSTVVRSRAELKSIFLDTRLEVQHLYQFLMLNDYLPRVLCPEILKKIYRDEIFFETFENGVYIPKEFAGAVFRFGHSQVRSTYKFNPKAEIELFAIGQPSNFTYVDWNLFFDVKGVEYLGNKASKIDLILMEELFSLLPNEDKDELLDFKKNGDLSYINLLRGINYQLASGQAILKEINNSISNSKNRLNPCSFDNKIFDKRIRTKTPLWLYILNEAAKQGEGEHLGQLGSTIVGETIYGILKADPNSYLNDPDKGPDWKPCLGGKRIHTMMNLLEFAGIERGALVPTSNM